MPALTNPVHERYCQARSVNGNPGGKQVHQAVAYALDPVTSTTEAEILRGIVTQNPLVAARIAELGGEASPVESQG